jgi:hypothetical protein
MNLIMLGFVALLIVFRIKRLIRRMILLMFLVIAAVIFLGRQQTGSIVSAVVRLSDRALPGAAATPPGVAR